MLAAALLRLREGGRRGGGVGLAVAGAAVFLVALSADAARYALATDLAATLGYLFALFAGALPLAQDRERRRDLLPAASPVAAWRWSVGNAMGCAAAAGLAALVLYFAAGAGCATAGGIPTRVARGFEDDGTLWLPLKVPVRAGDSLYRFATRVASLGASTPDRYEVRIDGDGSYGAPIGMPLEIPAPAQEFVLRNATEGLAVGIVSGETRALGGARPFSLNALAACLGPSLGTAGLAALCCAFAAHLSGAVASLLGGLVLLLASMRGFLLDAVEHGGAGARQVTGAAVESSAALLRPLLAAVPDLSRLDGSSRVARGEWIGAFGAAPGLAYLAAALLLAALLGELARVRVRMLIGARR